MNFGGMFNNYPVTYNSTWSLPDGGNVVLHQFTDETCQNENSTFTLESGRGHGTVTFPVGDDGFFYTVSLDRTAASTKGSVATFTSETITSG